MDFKICIIEGKARKIEPNQILAKSLIASASQAIETAKGIKPTDTTKKTIMRELYEGLREQAEALIAIYGYKVYDHISITCFLKDIAKEPPLSEEFDRYRKIRNGINYYGNDINAETIKTALVEIPELMHKIKTKMNEQISKSRK